MLKKSMPYDLVFVTTSSDLDLLEQYFKSLNSNNSLNLLVVVVCQKGLELIPSCNNITHVHLIKINNKLSLSKARNYALEWLELEGIKYSYIMFPDDDSTFDMHFFNKFKMVVNEGLNFLIDVRNQLEPGYFIKHNFEDGQRLGLISWNKSCSVNMIINFSTVSKLRRFDEKLGVGAQYGAGEDSDFFIRAVRENCIFTFTNALYTIHPAALDTYRTMSLEILVKRFKNYGRGVVFVLMKHSMYLEAVKVCFRGVAGSIISALKGNFKLSYAYFRSFLARIQVVIFFILNKEKEN